MFPFVFYHEIGNDLSYQMYVPTPKETFIHQLHIGLVFQLPILYNNQVSMDRSHQDARLCIRNSSDIFQKS